MDQRNIFPKFISNQLPEGAKSNSNIFLAIAIAQILIGVTNFLIRPDAGSSITYLIFGMLWLALYYYEYHYKGTLGLLFTTEKIRNEISRKKRVIICKNEVQKIEIRLLEIDFTMKDGTSNKIELGNFSYNSIREIKGLSLEFARINDIPFTLG